MTGNLKIPRTWADAADQVANKIGKTQVLENCALLKNYIKE